MKIVWVSPNGDGWSLAYRLRELGNKVVYYNPTNKNGLGYLPSVTQAAWMDYAKKADLVVCDGVPDSRRTRRSWSASDLSVDLQQLRHGGVAVLGPTPTTELIHNDPRYRKKILARHGIDQGAVAGGMDVTISLDPNAQAWIIFRHRHLLGDANGPELGNLGDVVLPLGESQPIVQNTVGRFRSFLEGIGYRGYYNLHLSVTHDKLQARDVTTDFLYPGVFVQFPNLLLNSGGEQPVVPGLAVSLFDLERNERDRVVEELLQHPGVFGADLHRKPEEGGTFLHGPFAGAVVGIEKDWVRVEADVYRKLRKLVGSNPGLGFRERVGSNVDAHMASLREWGYVR